MLCAVPARGGSKRLPRKNLRALRGKPLLAYTIEVARASGLFPEVYVCTDDEEIASVARQCGALVPSLVPPDLCGDFVASHIPCQYIAKRLAEQGQRPDTLVCLQPTSPLRSIGDISSAVCQFQQGHYDFVVSVTPLDPHDFHWAVVPGENGYWRMFFQSQYMKERPLLPPVYRPNGSIKIARLQALAQTGHFFGERMGVTETPANRSVHVAEEFDLRLCEMLLAELAR
jgi:CMP-N-acetylneuraminic acid synthetase